MKKLYLYAVLMVVLMTFTSWLILAQDEPDFSSPDPFFDPPTVPLRACSEGDTQQVCDMIATKPEDIIGVWLVYWMAEPAYIRFNADGTWVTADTAANTAAGPVEGMPSGTYSFDEDVFTTISPDAMGCEAADYILHVIKMGDQPVALNHAVRKDCFAPRRTDYAYTLLWAGE